MKEMPNPLKDGIDHINIYSKSLDPLGKWLSHFTRSPFVHPSYGKFESMEAYWYWCATGMIHEDLKQSWGYTAKELGKKYKRIPNPNFNENIKVGIRCKILQNKEWKNRFRISELPFKHYYVFGSIHAGKCSVVEPKLTPWLVKIYEDLRKELKDNFVPGE